MKNININGKKYNISNNYDKSRSAWVETLDDDTKKLILDYTILWNMVEHQVFDDNYNINKTTECIDKILSEVDNNNQITYIWKLYKDYTNKYSNIEELHKGFNFKNSKISVNEISKLYNSNDVSDKLKLLILSCYRVRCNLFHGPKCICYLDDQKLLFLSMNELLSLISKNYGM